ncbi:MAG: DUF3179 domain-containing protein [Natronomonas sp.]
MERISRRAVLASVGISALAGCLGDDQEGTTTGGTTAAIDNEDVEMVTLDNDFQRVLVGGDPPADEPDDAPPFADRRLSLPMTPESLNREAQDGGPPKDGIPSVDDPAFVSPSEADFLDDDDVVLAVAGESEQKAYPRSILVRHEIVNDTLDGTPVSVTYCPLTGTAQGFERGDTTLGVSGMLINNNLVMFDREMERWWPQIPAVSIPTRWSWVDTDGGATLREFEVVRTSWGQWRDAHPETAVMSENTGFAQDYGRDPYARRGYYESDQTLFRNTFEHDRYHAKEWVYGTRTEDGEAAFLKETLQNVGVIHGSAGDRPIVAVYDPTLDTAYVYRNPTEETFEYRDGVVEDEGGTTHRPDELPLDRIISFDAYWFAWIAYYPNTNVYG